ncbi:MAG: hypothetical protein C0592_04765 [Marinilabiliales bacterium]|nr:MAG: hypothetical protein C0592_04765 [Marinilabiliales bacterium]
MKPAFFLVLLFASFVIYAQQTITDDRDGQSYSIVQIGDQIWLGENMNYKATESWCPEGAPELCNEYGRLYSFESAKDACPIGWRLPTDTEFQQLADYLGGSEIAGLKLKEAGLDHWAQTTRFVTNSSGFSARASGNFWGDGGFDEVGEWVTFWTSSVFYNEEMDEYYVWTWTLYADDSTFERDSEDVEMGLSVRCIQD